MRKNAVICICLVLSFIAGSRLYAQDYVYANGSTPFTTQIPIENGYIAVNNGEIHMEIPLAAQTQRGQIPVNESLVYDSRIWKIFHDSGFSDDYDWQPTNVPNSMGGWRLSTGMTTAPTYSSTYTEYGSCGQGQEQHPTQEEFWKFAWTDPQGTKHQFDTAFDQQLPLQPCAPNVQPSSTSGWALDGSGYYLTGTYDLSTGEVDTTVYDKHGNEVYPLLEDTNGNYMSTDSNGNLVDTLGLTPVETTTSGDQITYSVLTYGGARAHYVVTTEAVYYNTDFEESDVTEASGSFTAIKSILLPDGSSYSFTYDSGTGSGHYGELTSVTLPSGGVINYAWLNYKDSFQNENRWIWTRVKDGGTTTFLPQTISLCSGSSGCQEKTTVTGPSGNDTVYTFTLDPGTDSNAGSWNTGITAYQGSASSGTALKSVSTSYSTTTTFMTISPTLTVYYAVPHTQTVLTSLPDVGLTSQRKTTFDSIGARPVDVQQWNYYSGSAPSSPYEETAYSYSSPYYVNGASVLTQTAVTDSSGNLISKTQYGYDQTTPAATSGLPNHATVSGNHANLTTVSQWVNTSGHSLSTTMTYDDAGTLLTKTDSNGTTTYGHDSTDTFVKSTTPPTPSSGVVLTSHATYDESTGLLTSQTDPNSKTTTYKSYDAFGRAHEIDYPDGGKTIFSFTPTQRSEQRYQSANTYEDIETQYDGYGRVSRVAVSNGQSSDPWYQTDTCYNTDGEVDFKSYRYQGAGFGQGKVCSGAGDSYVYDALGRVTDVTHGDGTAVGYGYRGRAIETTDENEVKRITQKDAFGRITEVCEISSNSSMPGSGSPTSCGTDIAGTGFITSYAYQPASHTTTITQGAQTRKFQTDFLGRTILTQEPELQQAGQPPVETTWAYSYNSTGLQAVRTRPKANQTNPATTTTTTTQYDALGRVVSISYSDGTPTKTFAYDANTAWQWSGFTPTNLKGRLYAAITGSQALGTVYSYGPMGRVNRMRQCGPSNCGTSGYATSYTYDWLGDLQSLEDGQGASESYTYSPASEVTSITSSLNSATHPPDIVSNVQNGPDGPISYSLGNGLSQFYSYDSLGRLSGGWVCAGTPEVACPNQAYGFYISSRKGDQIHTVSDNVMGQGVSYTYDDMGRLASKWNSSGQQLYSYVYDRYGNRWEQNVMGGSGPAPQLSFNTSTNHIIGDTYDAAGNLISDGNYTYTYDAEGNLTKVDGGAEATYTYNALNQRVRIDIGADSTATQEFVYDPWGRATSSHAVAEGWPWAIWTYWGKSHTLVATDVDSQTYFEHLDWEGTERVRTTYNGHIETLYNSLPFGDGYTVTGSAQDPYYFAGMNTDYYNGYNSGTDHAKFRQYDETDGRWMSPDPYSGSYNFSNPQSFNRYSYVMDNPLGLTDPSGRDPFAIAVTTFCGGASGACAGSFMAGLSNPVTAAVIGGIAAVAELGHLFGWWGSQFHGSLKPRPNAPSSDCSVSSTSLDQYIAQAKPSSPLIGQGSNFMATGLKYNLDPRLLVSIAGAETTFGTAITAGKYNALNIMYNGYHSNFSSFKSNINSAGKSLTNPANGYDLTNTSTMYGTYCSGSGCATGLKNLNTFMKQQGANTNALHDPCGHQG